MCLCSGQCPNKAEETRMAPLQPELKQYSDELSVKNALADLTMTRSAMRTERRNVSSINTRMHFDDVMASVL